MIGPVAGVDDVRPTILLPDGHPGRTKQTRRIRNQVQFQRGWFRAYLRHLHEQKLLFDQRALHIRRRHKAPNSGIDLLSEAAAPSLSMTDPAPIPTDRTSQPPPSRLWLQDQPVGNVLIIFRFQPRGQGLRDRLVPGRRDLEQIGASPSVPHGQMCTVRFWPIS